MAQEVVNIVTGSLSTRPDTRQRQIFCNRTLNLRSIKAIGYDMDYTLIHYVVREWEQRAYEHAKARLLERGWPIEHLTFEDTMIRGLIIDQELGNVVKANRFGYIKRGVHGTRPIPFGDLKARYARTIIGLDEARWEFMNTFFSLSEACLYLQLVDLLDEHKLPGVLGYADLYRVIRRALDAAHMEGQLKQEIIADPQRFVELDPDTPLALLDQKRAGKRLLLITNSGWRYTRSMMAYAFDPFLPDSMTWRDVFEVIIVSARKPVFFSSKNALFEVVNEDGLLRPSVGGIREPGIYLGGGVDHVESYLGASGDEILYVGDHIFGDVHVSKRIQRWRTGLVVRELEDEIAHIEAFGAQQVELQRRMAGKQDLEDQICATRLSLQRLQQDYGPQPSESEPELIAREAALREQLSALDQTIAPLAKASGELANPDWGLLMRTGNDKSHLARQIERYADIYTSRVSNFLAHSPFKYLRSARGSLPHDPGVASDLEL